jgi:proteasome accessory factor BC
VSAGEKTNKDLRQLNLIAYLLNHRFPVTWEEIRQRVPGYQPVGGVDEKSILRKFERDKEELRAQGIPIDTVPIDSEVLMGYRLDRERFYLPRLAFTEVEWRALLVALRRVAIMKGFPLAREAGSALRKLLFESGEGTDADGRVVYFYSGQHISGTLETIGEALMEKKKIKITYYSPRRDEETVREVHPYGLVYQGGGWYLVGWCSLRNDLRQFRLERIRSLQVNRNDPETPDYSIPRTFSLRDFMNREPWDYSARRPTRVELRLSPVLYEQAVARWAGRRDVAFPDPHDRRMIMPVRDDAAFAGWVLSQLGEVEILSPRQVRRRMRSLIRTMAARYQEPPGRAEAS